MLLLLLLLLLFGVEALLLSLDSSADAPCRYLMCVCDEQVRNSWRESVVEDWSENGPMRVRAQERWDGWGVGDGARRFQSGFIFKNIFFNRCLNMDV